MDYTGARLGTFSVQIYINNSYKLRPGTQISATGLAVQGIRCQMSYIKMTWNYNMKLHVNPSECHQ